jgi:pimeloyl-ACP methyl ester carboxylesterase
LHCPRDGSDPAVLGTVSDDADAAGAAFADIAGDVVVVGHSYGGVVITEAQFDSRARDLVYLGAFMPDTAQSLFDLLPPRWIPAIHPRPCRRFDHSRSRDGDRLVLRRLRSVHSAVGGIHVAPSQRHQQRNSGDLC